MRSPLVETTILVSAIILSAGCSKELAVTQPRDLPVVALLEHTSDFDHGVKAIVFPNGVAFVMRVDLDPASRSNPIKMHKVVLSRMDQQSLLNVIDRHHFFDLPRDMRSKVLDGSSVHVLCADAHREHWVYSYHSHNPDFLAFQKVFMDTISGSAAAAESVTGAEFVEGIATEVESLPTGSPLRNTAATWLNWIVRCQRPAFWGVGDTTRFTLPGGPPRLPGFVEWEEVKRSGKSTASDQRTAAEDPTVMDVPLPDPDPIVVDFPVLGR